MLWTIFVVLLILWLLGFIGHFGGGLIHILLVIAVIVLIFNLVAAAFGLRLATCSSVAVPRFFEPCAPAMLASSFTGKGRLPAT